MANPESIVVGGVPILYGRFSDWTYPQFGTLVTVLSNGTSVDNEVLQSGPVPRRRTTLSGWIQDALDKDTLDTYVASKTIVTVDDDGAQHEAVILDLSWDRTMPGLWSCTLQLVDYTGQALLMTLLNRTAVATAPSVSTHATLAPALLNQTAVATAPVVS